MYKQALQKDTIDLIKKACCRGVFAGLAQLFPHCGVAGEPDGLAP